MDFKLDKLFEKSVYNTVYTEAGDDVNYAFEEDGDTLYIHFEGSDSITDWVLNFWFFKKPYKDMKIPYKVHGGFLRCWKSVENIIINKITQKKRLASGEFVFKYNKIISIGYSHGGALSGFCHECVWYHRPDIRDNIYGFGFESPRFYHGLFVKKELRERWANYTVIRNHTDIVTYLPPRWLFFTHVGTVLHLKRTSMKNYRWPKFIGSHWPDAVLESLVDYSKK